MASDSNIENPLANNTTYQARDILGQGTFGVVMLAAERTTGRKVAIKFIKDIELSKSVERELLNHSLLVHPHIVRFEDSFITGNSLALVLEFASGGTLLEYVRKRGRLREAEARPFFQQITLALDYCHKMGIANRDIKLENTLLDWNGNTRKYQVKLCDFGLSINEELSEATTSVGTPDYIAPEVWRSTRYDAKLADIWSLGVMLYTMLTGSYPFSRSGGDQSGADTHEEKSLHISKGEYGWPPSPYRTRECRDLVARMLKVDPTNRISVEGIQTHPWVCKDLPGSLDVDAYNAEFTQHLQSPEVLKTRQRVLDMLEVLRHGAPHEA